VTSENRQNREGERGSALVIAVLVSVILALLGISFLLMGETENRIAQNEKRAAQALYAAEAGSMAVKRWFDDPSSALRFPPPSVVDRTQRRILDENDPYDPADVIPANGTIGSFPYYKQGVNLDGMGGDDLFDRPYQSGMLHSLMGTPEGPDMRIDESDGAARTFLEDLTQTLLGDFPGEGGGIYALISRIDIYAPPYIEVGANWSRYGLATVKVTARLYKPDRGGERVIAEKEIETVLGEAPYQGPYGPLHSCGGLNFRNLSEWTLHWGPITAAGATDITAPATNPLDQIPESLPREEPGMPRVDPLWNTVGAVAFNNFKHSIDGSFIDDPWFRMLSRGAIAGLAAGAVQPEPPFPYPPPGEAPDYCCDHSNLAHSLPLVPCPVYDYDIWKLVAISGERDVRYFVWSGGSRFRENGAGEERTFQEWTAGEEGVYFFETMDRLLPHDTDGDGLFDNLTPAITVSGDWHFRGLIYLNSFNFSIDHTPATLAVLNAPGEPFQDADQDGIYDAGEAWINLAYPTTAGTIDNSIEADADSSGSPVRDPRGPDITGVPVSFEGILFTNGFFEATGNATYYGTVIARQGVTQADPGGAQPTPHIYWDESIKNGWPPPGWALPRTVITSWRTQR
jgi:hypothetical protein